jgi:hypothetical protein
MMERALMRFIEFQKMPPKRVIFIEGATRYAALTEIQQLRAEIIESLQKMMEQALVRFIEFQKMPPKRVIFFRDGVSEGEQHCGYC